MQSNIMTIQLENDDKMAMLNSRPYTPVIHRLMTYAPMGA